MINLIVGENSTGKTLYLESLVKTGRELINLERLDKYLNTPYNQFRLEKLRELDICDVDASNPFHLSLVEPDRPLSIEFTKLVSLMCKDGNVLLLDEPDKNLLWYEDYYFISFLSAVSSSFKEIYVVTNDDEILDLKHITKLNYMTVKKNRDTVTSYNITEEKANELIDKV